MKIILIILLSITLYANTKQKMLKFYKNKQYESACNIGFSHFTINKHDENFISLYAFSCLKSDHIDRLTLPIILLKSSPQARTNSAYFSVILMQKKILLHALLDGYKVSALNLPTTDFILSKVFDLYTKLNIKKHKNIYLLKDKDDKNISYKLYLGKNKFLNKIIIEKYDNMKLIKRHIYW